VIEPSRRPGAWSTHLVANGAFDAESAFGYLQRHAIPGVERVDLAAQRLTRLLRVRHAIVPVDVALRDDGIQLRLTEADAEHAPQVIGKVRRWFDLDADLVTIGEVLDLDPVLGAIGRTFPGLRVIGYPDGFEGAVATVLGQQVSLGAARTFAGRLAAAYGTPGPAGLTLFPPPERLAAAPLEELRSAIGVPNARARTLKALAELFAGGFQLEPVSPHDDSRSPSTSSGREEGSAREAERLADARAALLAVPGIGPWTAEYLALRALHDSDACPAGDLVLRRALDLDRAADVVTRAAAWRPYRAYAVVRLWAAAVAGLSTGAQSASPRIAR
jgi:3-methyladenine DNA glycosylase/8-oxoguanine DNA glycosylase